MSRTRHSRQERKASLCLSLARISRHANTCVRGGSPTAAAAVFNPLRARSGSVLTLDVGLQSPTNCPLKKKSSPQSREDRPKCWPTVIAEPRASSVSPAFWWVLYTWLSPSLSDTAAFHLSGPIRDSAARRIARSSLLLYLEWLACAWIADSPVLRPLYYCLLVSSHNLKALRSLYNLKVLDCAAESFIDFVVWLLMNHRLDYRSFVLLICFGRWYCVWKCTCWGWGKRTM